MDDNRTFPEYIADLIFDEDVDYEVFKELACRKLVDLGVVELENGQYTYNPSTYTIGVKQDVVSILATLIDHYDKNSVEAAAIMDAMKYIMAMKRAIMEIKAYRGPDRGYINDVDVGIDICTKIIEKYDNLKEK